MSAKKGGFARTPLHMPLHYSYIASSAKQYVLAMWSTISYAVLVFAQNILGETMILLSQAPFCVLHGVQQLQQFLKEALKKAEEATDSRLQTQTQISQLQDSLKAHKRDRTCLLSSLCLLSSTLFPVLDRLHRLALQKTLLLDHLSSSGYGSLEKMAVGIAQPSLTSGLGVNPTASTAGDSTGARFMPLHPLLRFRKAAIALLAIVHLKALCRESTLLFTASITGTASPSHHHQSLPVCIGSKYKKMSERGLGACSSLLSTEKLTVWLNSGKVMRAARQAMEEIQREFELQSTTRKTRHNSHNSHRANLPICCGFTHLVQELGSLYTFSESSLVFSPASGSHFGGVLCYAGSSLAQRLGQGLAALSARYRHKFSFHTTPLQVCIVTIIIVTYTL